MHTFLMVVLAIVSIFIIVSVLLQKGNSDGLSGAITGGAEQLFGQRKSRGYDAILKKITIISSVLFLILSLVIVTLY